MKFCTSCGTQLKDDAKFCVSCGAAQPVAASAVPAQPPVYAAPAENAAYSAPAENTAYAAPAENEFAGYAAPPVTPAPPVKKKMPKGALVAIIVAAALIVCAGGYFAVDHFFLNKDAESSDTDAGSKAEPEPTAEVKKSVITGDWTAELDGTQAILDSLAAEDFDVSGIKEEFIIPFTMTLNKDGTYVLEVDRDSVSRNFTTWMQALVPIMAEMVYQDAIDSGSTRDEADAQLEEIYGMDVTEYCQAIVDSMAAEDYIDFSDTSDSGYYKVKDGKLFFAATQNDFDSNEYIEYTLDGDKLTFVSMTSNASAFLGDMSELLPFVFEK